MMLKVHAYMAHRVSTPERQQVAIDTYEEARKLAGVEDFDVRLVILGDDLGVWRAEWIDPYTYNVGQHVVFNDQLAQAESEGADLLLRLDDDVEFLTKDWLKKMLTAMEDLGPGHIISPTVRGLMHPIPTSQKYEAAGHNVKLAQAAMGGICRLHWVQDLTKEGQRYISDVRKPLGFGDATGIVKWAQQNDIQPLYLTDVKVKHRDTTEGQIKDDPHYHARHALYQVMPYIPPYKGPVNAN